MIGEWFGKIKEMFFGEEINTENNTRTRNNKSTGRIINNQNNVEPKVIHRYPEGKFRFPVIPDQNQSKEIKPSTERRKVNHNSIPVQNTSYEKVETQKSKEKFTGRNFRAREIPSPVYGFGERSLYVKKDLDQTNPESELVKTENQEVNYNIPTYDQVTVPDYAQESTNLMDEEEGMAEQYEYQALSKIMMHDEDTVYLEEEVNTDLKDNDFIDLEDQSDSIGSMDVVEDLPSSAYESTSIEALDSSLAMSVAQTQTIPEQRPVATVVNHEEPVSHSSYTSEIKKEPVQQQSVTVDQREPKKYVPFNVLMLKQDKRNIQPENNSYRFPPVHLLESPSYSAETDADWLLEQQELLQSTLDNFNVKAAVIGAVQGPAVTRLEVQPSPGVKVSKITNLSDDIKLSLAARDIRIEAPIPGRNAVGIEVPNLKSRPVPLREIIQSQEFRNSSSPLTVALGLDISGKPVVTDLQKMPHGLIAGATGSGKSVCINSILISLFYKADPDEVKLLLVDPKMVELAPYNRIPHLVTPVITDAKEATNALKWAVDEMERRYEEFSNTGVRDIKRYNEVARTNNKEKMPYIVIVIDELADLMMVSPHDVEEAICRIAQKARACGIHLLLATQRPSVDVITGLIKANIPTRTAFSVSSQVDSRTILDTSGAEKLLGKGDMLFLGNGTSKAERIQGTFVSDEEIERITSFIRKQKEPQYLFEKEVLIQQSAFGGDFEDDLFFEACEFVLEQGVASSSALQRRFRIGFNRAARLVEMMEAKGIVSEAMGSKPRNVLISKEEYEEQVFDN